MRIVDVSRARDRWIPIIVLTLLHSSRAHLYNYYADHRQTVEFAVLSSSAAEQILFISYAIFIVDELWDKSYSKCNGSEIKFTLID